MGKCAKGELEQEGYYSLVTFREVFFVNVVHRKPENCGAKRVTVNGNHEKDFREL